MTNLKKNKNKAYKPGRSKLLKKNEKLIKLSANESALRNVFKSLKNYKR